MEKKTKKIILYSAIILIFIGSMIWIDERTKQLDYTNCREVNYTLNKQYLDYDNVYCEDCLILEVSTTGIIFSKVYHFENNKEIKDKWRTGDILTFYMCDIEDNRRFIVNGIVNTRLIE